MTTPTPAALAAADIFLPVSVGVADDADPKTISQQIDDANRVQDAERLRAQVIIDRHFAPERAAAQELAEACEEYQTAAASYKHWTPEYRDQLYATARAALAAYDAAKGNQ